MREQLRFDEGVDFLFELVELVKNLNVGGDGCDLLFDVGEVRITVVELSDQVFVVHVFVVVLAFLVASHTPTYIKL